MRKPTCPRCWAELRPVVVRWVGFICPSAECTFQVGGGPTLVALA